MQANFSAPLFRYLFVYVALMDICSHFLQWPLLHYYTKGLLIPLLALSFFDFRQPLQSPQKALLAALGLSWLGDVALLFEQRHALFFVLGLGAFLSAHVVYIWIFMRQRSRPVAYFYLMLPMVLGYVAALLYYLLPAAGDLQIPVLLYAAVLMCMLLATLYRKQASRWIVAGALLFVLSDSLLAINKFVFDIPFAQAWIMMSYLAAQYALVRGLLQAAPSPQPTLTAL